MEYEVDYYQKTHLIVCKFAKSHPFSGWFIDITGCYGCLIGKYWISIFVNDMDDSLKITVDTIGENGFFDKNLEWETPKHEDAMVETAMRFMAKYAAKY